MQSTKNITVLAKQVGQQLKKYGLVLATAESCTGGRVAEAITRITGSSAWFDRGFVTYSNQAKADMLGVKKTTLKKYGAVSEQVALEMVQGALKYSDADIAVAITGIAGPSGGTKTKPVGSVWFAWQKKRGKGVSKRVHFRGGREMVRNKATVAALQGVLNLFEISSGGEKF